LHLANLVVDFPEGLPVRTQDDMPHQGGLFSRFMFDHHPHVDIVKQDKVFPAFQVSLDQPIFIHRASQAEG
jgi:hypothetical protein